MEIFQEDDVEYAGFWIRVGATLIDMILLCIVIYPCLISIYGVEYFQSEKFVKGIADLLLSWIFPFIATVILWINRAGTPGKLLLNLRITDANSGGYLTVPQAVGRYFAYIPAAAFFFLGLFWIGWDSKKQGWHDKLAGTIVIRKKVRTEKVSFTK